MVREGDGGGPLLGDGQQVTVGAVGERPLAVKRHNGHKKST